MLPTTRKGKNANNQNHKSEIPLSAGCRDGCLRLITMFVIKIIILTLGTMSIVWVSRSSLRDVRSHGFYRFLSWETILLLFIMNVNYWFKFPSSLPQMISWLLLIISLALIYLGVQSFRRQGKINQERDDPHLVGIEKTTQLVTTGVYHFIRHPFYSSLLFLGWGILFKNVSLLGLVLAITNTILLVVTARQEEKENIQFFGERYREYMTQTRMFIPYVW